MWGVLNNGLLTPVLADTEKTITGLGTGAIGNPVPPADKDTPWTGSYVYYGKYDTNGDDIAEPVKYRVLDKATTKFGGNTLFLDCDSTLYSAKFYDGISNAQGHKINEWAYSDVKKGLSGNAFLEKDGCFIEMEKKAIAESTVEAHDLVEGTGAGKVSETTKGFFNKYVALNNEKVFLLDAEDASNLAYGYITDSNGPRSRIKTRSGSVSEWWLRSANSNENAGNVSIRGSLVHSIANNADYGVSPAFNVNLSSVIFTSLISNTGNAGQPGAEYKLTLSDNNMEISIPDGGHVSRNGNTITVPYTISGTNSNNTTQVSVLITDEPYIAGETKTRGFDYQKLDTGTGEFSGTGTGTFTLPDEYSDKACGTNYYAYILAEDVRGEKETDYASAPVSIPVPSIPKITAQPTDLSLTYGYNNGNTLTISATGYSGHSLSYQWYSNTTNSNEGGTAVDGATSNSYTIPEGKNAGTTGYYYCEVTDSTANSAVKSKAAKVTVAKKPVTVSGIKAKDKDYDGKEDAELDFSEAAIDGKIEGDDLSVTATGKFTDVNAGENKEVQLSGLTLTGNKKNNYVLADESGQQKSAAATIRKADYKGKTTAYKTVKASGTEDTLTLPCKL